MIDHKKVKLGKKPAKVDPRTLRVSKYFKKKLPVSPPTVDYTKGLKQWGMFLNDQIGTCTIAALLHAEEVVTQWSGNYRMTLPDSCALQKYEQWAGYNPSDPSTDQGAYEIDILNHYRQSPGLWRHTLRAYADPDAHNLEEVRKSIELFGGVYIGIELPLLAAGKRIWDAPKNLGDSNAIPGSWGGHAVFVPRYWKLANGETLFACISWSEVYYITESFWLYQDPQAGPYIDEVHALLINDWVRWKGMPEGLDLATLEADLIAVTS